MSIKRKLTLMMLGISLAAVMLTVTAITAYLIYDMHESKLKELAVTATLTGDRNSAAIAFMDNAKAHSNLEIFKLNPSIMLACVYDANGAFFAGHEEGSITGLICPPSVAAIKATLADMFTASQPIMQNGQSVGHIYMVSDRREIDAYVHKIIIISATAALVVFMVTLLLTVYFQRTISGPILELAATAQRITQQRDYTLEAKAVYKDETGVLAQAFNDMLGEVRNRDNELRQYNETLEHKVHERTHQLELSKRKAEEASEAKSEFLRNMSHELRTPLHAIISFSSYGVKEHASAKPAQLRQYFELIQRGAERLSRLVDEVLDLARLEHGKQMFLLKQGDMRELAARSAETVRSLLEEKQISLRFDFGGEPSLTVCDHDKIAQVITNLLGNAIKFTPPGRGITLSTDMIMEAGSEHMAVSIKDEGVGIPAGEAETIFESFRQSSRTNTGAGGTGLGLAICRGIVQAHGGHIEARNNTDGPGACVTFTIPAMIAEGKRLVQMHTTEEKHENAA